MSANTGIEWTNASWNPVRGCSRVSEGCRHCYAEGMAYRFSGPGQAYEGLVRINAAGERKREWNGQIKLVEGHLLDPLKWREPQRIFVNSMSDLFHPNVPDEWIDKVFAVMALCPQHSFQILTKRPHKMRDYVLGVAGRPKGFESALNQTLSKYPNAEHRNMAMWPQQNVWLGVSCEDQAAADERIPLLLKTPAAVRFISAEPLLGPLDLERVLWPDLGAHRVDSLRGGYWGKASGHWLYSPSAELGEVKGNFTNHSDMRCLDWVICGGESRPGARPMHAEWAQSLRDQCVSAEVPFFFKQWGAWLPAMQDGAKLSSGQVVNASDQAEQVGKKKAGALLDGVEWKQFPCEVTR